jgi:ABC-2 type transport system ATP-binding protein
MIIVENLHKSYGSNNVLKNINLTFEKGKVYGIVGENGSGKTTLFKCISGIEKHKGFINNGNDSLKNKLGFLETDPFFFTKITGKEYLQLLCISRNVIETDLNDKNIFDLPLGQYASTYSTGMKKKLALTGILLQKNDYFILDEPFNGVDIESNIVIIELIHKLKELQKTVIISSHIFSTLSDTCDQIHLLKKGEIVKSVTKEYFSSLETEMKEITIGNKISRLKLK